MGRRHNNGPQTTRSQKHNHSQWKTRRRGCHRECCYSCANAAVIVFSSCFLLWAHHHSAYGFLPTKSPKAIAIKRSSASHLPLRSSNALDDACECDEDGSGEKSGFGEYPQLRTKQRRPSDYRSSQRPRANGTIHREHQRDDRCERDRVHEWLLRSASRILGEELTSKLAKGDVDAGFASPGRIVGDCDPELPSHFSSDEEFVLHAESVMRAWSRWISRRSNANGGSAHSSLDDDDDEVTCSASNAVKIIDAILNRVLSICDWRAREGGEGGDSGAAERETKAVELIGVAIGVDARGDGGGGEAVARAEGWLRVLRRRIGADDPPSEDRDPLSDDVLRLYEEGYGGVIKACVRSRERKHLERAMGLLEEMESQRETPLARAGAGLLPTTRTYNLVLYGLANCAPRPADARRAEGLLRGMIAGGAGGGPDANTFRQVVAAWTKSGGGAAAAENARRVLDEMLSDFPTLDPDASTFNALMLLYVKLGKTEEALSLFDLMTAMHETGRSDTRPDAYSVNLMLRAMSKRGPFRSLEDMEAVEGVLENLVQPDKQSYNIVIDAWAKSNLREAASRAVSLLNRMERKCLHDLNVAPDGYTFTSTINAIERSKHHRARGSWAEKIFNRMRDLHSRGLAEEPTTPVYNALMNAVISSGEGGSLERAESLFAEMRAAGLANTRTFNTLLKGYGAFPSRPREAERLLTRMELSYRDKGGASPVGPDKYSYTTAISAYGRSDAPRKAAGARAILRRMIASYLGGNAAARPGTFAFNAVLNACAHTRPREERLEAFTILCSTLVLQRDWAEPDHTTYGTFLQASSNLLPRDEVRRLRVVEAVFDSCVKEGQCGQMVVRNLKNVASPELYDALVGRFRTDDGLDIPLQWKRNVAGHKDCLATSYFDSK